MPNPNPSAAQTDGKFVAAAVQVSGTNVVANQTVGASGSGKNNPGNYSLTMSLTSAGGFAATTQLTPKIVDALNVTNPTAFTLTSVANASGGLTVYTGTITLGAANFFAGFEFTIAGFLTAANNGTFLCTASTATTLTLTNVAGVTETHAGTASSFVGSAIYYSYGDPGNKAGAAPAWYKPGTLTAGYDANVASVSSSGLITARALGQTVIEISFPVFDNTLGNSPAAQLEPINFIYTQIVVTVIP